jgi:hypothetical protein
MICAERFLVAMLKFFPIFLFGRLKAIPMTLEIRCQIVQIMMQLVFITNIAQIIAVGFVSGSL